MTKKYMVSYMTYSYIDKLLDSDSIKRTVEQYNVEFDSFSELEESLECDVGKLFEFKIVV